MCAALVNGTLLGQVPAQTRMWAQTSEGRMSGCVVVLVAVAVAGVAACDTNENG